MYIQSILKLRAAVVIAALTVALVSPALRAQSSTDHTRVDVPFAFEVGSAHFQPGQYVLGKVGESTLMIGNGRHSAMTLSAYETGATPASHGKVVFYRYGNRYFLREVWRTGEEDHIVCTESKAELRIRREMHADRRASLATPTNVEVALVERPR